MNNNTENTNNNSQKALPSEWQPIVNIVNSARRYEVQIQEQISETENPVVLSRIQNLNTSCTLSDILSILEKNIPLPLFPKVEIEVVSRPDEKSISTVTKGSWKVNVTIDGKRYFVKVTELPLIP
jgi:hypothetical protein